MKEDVRVTLVLPKKLWEDAKQLVPSGQRSRLVAEALEAEIRRQRRNAQLGKLRQLHESLQAKYGILPAGAADIEAMREERNHDSSNLH